MFAETVQHEVFHRPECTHELDCCKVNGIPLKFGASVFRYVYWRMSRCNSIYQIEFSRFKMVREFFKSYQCHFLFRL